MAERIWQHAAVVAITLLVLVGCADDEPDEDEAAVAPTVAPTAALDEPQDGPALTEAEPPSETAAAPDVAAPAPLSAVEVVDRVSPAVVTVVNEQQLVGFGREQTQEAGRGTGFIIDERGHVVTNEHVVRGGDRFVVIFADGEKRPAELVGADPLSDLAVLRFDGPVPATVPLGDSEDLQVGQSVLAIGSPLGEFTNTVTDGIVSGLDRDLPGGAAPGEPLYSNLVQHTAPINPGNSGGPLFDLTGRVVGVNTLGIPQTPAGVPAQGLFFAIPSDTVREIASLLIEEGRVPYPYLGVELRQITPQIASQYDLPVDYGAYVAGVEPGGPAAQAGIREGDFILSLGGEQIDADTSLTEALFAHRPGETVEVTVLRDGDEVPLQVTLGERPSR